MKKLLNMSRKWMLVIISVALLITLVFVSVSTIWRGKDKLFFIEEGKENYCYTTQGMKGSDVSKYDNITLIAENSLDAKIENVEILYYKEEAFDTKVEVWLPIEAMTKGISSYLAWENKEVPRKMSMYLATNIDGKNADNIRQESFDIAFEVKENMLKIKIKPRLKRMEFFSFNVGATGWDKATQTQLKDLELYFYTLITD